MSKYIDAEKLKKLIDNLESFSCISEEQDGFYSALSRVNDVIDSLQQEQQDVDWVDFRREAAKEILANMLSCPTTMNLGEKAIKTVGDYVSFAIGLADELIKQLKE